MFETVLRRASCYKAMRVEEWLEAQVGPGQQKMSGVGTVMNRAKWDGWELNNYFVYANALKSFHQYHPD